MTQPDRDRSAPYPAVLCEDCHRSTSMHCWRHSTLRIPAAQPAVDPGRILTEAEWAEQSKDCECGQPMEAHAGGFALLHHDEFMHAATQPPADSERRITEAEYQRLLAAENVAVMFGWCPVREGTGRERVAHDLWKKWYDLAGATFAGPRAHPDLVALEEEEAAGG